MKKTIGHRQYGTYQYYCHRRKAKNEYHQHECYGQAMKQHELHLSPPPHCPECGQKMTLIDPNFDADDPNNPENFADNFMQ